MSPTFRAPRRRVVITDSLFAARRGLATRVLDKPPSDAILEMVLEGTFFIDRANLRVWFKVGKEWRWAQLH